MEEHFYFPNYLPDCLNYNDEEEAWVKELILSDLSHAEIWSGSVSSTSVRRKDRDQIVKSIKTQLKDIQKGYCYYCGFAFDFRGGEKGESNIHRDHIAPKNLYRNFTFTPENLVLSCFICNGLDYKSNYDTISHYSENYHECEFSIIHPYFDERSQHLDVNSDGVISVINQSQKGRTTIKIFGLNETYPVMFRALSFTKARQKIDPDSEDIIKDATSKSYSSF